jgi:hypothetical protein
MYRLIREWFDKARVFSFTPFGVLNGNRYL